MNQRVFVVETSERSSLYKLARELDSLIGNPMPSGQDEIITRIVAIHVYGYADGVYEALVVADTCTEKGTSDECEQKRLF